MPTGKELRRCFRVEPPGADGTVGTDDRPVVVEVAACARRDLPAELDRQIGPGKVDQRGVGGHGRSRVAQDVNCAVSTPEVQFRIQLQGHVVRNEIVPERQTQNVGLVDRQVDILPPAHPGGEHRQRALQVCDGVKWTARKPGNPLAAVVIRDPVHALVIEIHLEVIHGVAGHLATPRVIPGNGESPRRDVKRTWQNAEVDTMRHRSFPVLGHGLHPQRPAHSEVPSHIEVANCRPSRLTHTVHKPDDLTRGMLVPLDDRGETGLKIYTVEEVGSRCRVTEVGADVHDLGGALAARIDSDCGGHAETRPVPGVEPGHARNGRPTADAEG